LAALIQTGEHHGLPMQVASAASRVNHNQLALMSEKIREATGGVAGKVLAMLGLSFKPNTNDLREAPALAISETLLGEGATIRAYDPAALEDACRTLPQLQPCRDVYHAAEGADALIIMTEWNQFRNLDFERLKSVMRRPILLDLRNIYDPPRAAAAGFRHISVGRSPEGPTKAV
jgi:UDPglucose 6-dehydrogenase